MNKTRDRFMLKDTAERNRFINFSREMKMVK